MKRVWNHQEINIMVYIYQHQKGVVFLYLNYTDNVYEENLILELRKFILYRKFKNC